MSLTIHSRNEWNAARPTSPRTTRSKSGIKRLYVHWPGGVPRSWQHVNTVPEEHSAIRGIQHFHQTKPDPFIDIGYSHVLAPNWGRPKDLPRVYTARGAHFIPAATQDDNTASLAICVLIGPDDPLLDSIKSRLRSYVRWAEDYVGHELKVLGHRQNVEHPGATECPGPRLLNYVRELDRV